ncbi:GAF domain-containing sensor histidine kinase [Amaricoccus macauensis]|uniref:GAF domain-containing sensor histidine kinase n=1 Tax=Amaricoccus macauensis TaxID=57001 RepID=UPI003C7EC885
MKFDQTVQPRFSDPLKQLYLLAVEPDLSLGQKVERLIALGLETLDLELGIVSSITDPVYEVLYVNGPDWAPTAGATFDVNGTYCLHTLRNSAVTAFHHAGKQEIAEHPCYLNFGLESYIGAPVLRGGQPFGTLNFSSIAARTAPFTQAQKDFVTFLARWLGNELKLEAERRELREQRSLLAAVIDAVPEAVMVADVNRRVTLINPALERHFGYTPEQLIGRQTAILYESMAEYEETGRKRFNQNAAMEKDRFTLSFRRADGTTFEGEVSGASVRTEKGEHLGYLGVIRDVTEQNRFERAKDQLISTVSHDLKTPLTSLYGALCLLDAQSVGMAVALREMVQMAMRNADVVQQMVSDLLDIETLRAGKHAADFEAVRLRPILERAVATVAPYAAECGVAVQLEDATGLEPKLKLDQQSILRLLTNLMTNAVKAAPEGTAVTLGISSDGHGFWVTDNGSGIPPEIQPSLFERFSRADSYRVKEGSGLGMSIVKAIVDQHLGKISFETAEWKGTTFHVVFPTSAEVMQEAETKEA